MPLVAPDIGLAVELGARVDELNLRQNMFTGPVKPAGEKIPARAVFLLATGGGPPQAFHSDGHELIEPTVQVRIRAGKREGYEDGLSLARAIREALQFVPVTGYANVKTTEPQPNYLGKDGDGLHEWSVNVTMTAKDQRSTT